VWPVTVLFPCIMPSAIHVLWALFLLLDEVHMHEPHKAQIHSGEACEVYVPWCFNVVSPV
jgi:hypothetical protein